MARNRQRAKQRQADRRARRLADEGAPAEARGADGAPAVEDPRAAPPAPGLDPSLAVGAPPQDEGRSDTVVEDEPELDDVEHLEEDEVEEEHEAEDAAGFSPRGRRGRDVDEPLAKDRPRFIQFLTAVWAELQRVQWPDRQSLTTLTGVVLAFVLIMGGYLGLLDAVFSRIIKGIL